MAEGAISRLLEPLIVDEFKLLSGVRDEIDLIRGEFSQMNALLQVVGNYEDDNPQFQDWVKQVRDIAYDTADVLEQFMLRLQYRRSGRHSWFYKTYGFMNTIFVRHQIATEVQRIKSKVSGISQSKQNYQHYTVGASTSNNVPTKTRHDTRNEALLLPESEIVGITKPKSELIEWLVDKKNHELQVVSVCGMGGLGKTTLVKKVFDDVETRKHFEARAWITVSMSFQIKELLKGLINELFAETKQEVPLEVQEMDQHKMKIFITDCLQSKRYVIVLDDVWSINDWDALRYAFPDNNLGSRVILTTRELAMTSIKKVYTLLPLLEKESWTLLCRKAFKGKSCPQGLEEITKLILKKCGGLPLAVVAIGGLLATKDQIIDEWNKIYRGLGSELGKEGKLTNVDQVLSISYFDLPWYQKLCFLYLSIFPEDHPIEHWLLIRLWIAEGFVQSTPGLTPEEVADNYLGELLNRSLILVAALGQDGRATKYQIHDIWRELILSRSIKQDLVTTFGAQQSSFPHKVRRLSIHNRMGNWQDIQDRVTHIQSLLMFGSRDSEFTMPIMDSLENGERLVKVLYLRNSGLQTFPPQIGKLLYLKYLNLSFTDIKEVPKSIGDLKKLETLDLMDTKVRELPREILKLHRLRHLLVYNTEVDSGFTALKGIEKLSGLQTLDGIELNISDSDVIVRNLGKLSELREIGISDLKSTDAKALCQTLQTLTELRSLRLRFIFIEDDEIIDLEPVSSPPKYLHTLIIRAHMEKLPKWIPSLQNLTKLELWECKFKEEPLLQLQNMPNLTYLYLWDAYEGESLIFQAGSFKKLTFLVLYSLYGLKSASIMEGAMCGLKELYIEFCPLMDELTGIEYLSCLTTLEVDEDAIQGPYGFFDIRSVSMYYDAL